MLQPADVDRAVLPGELRRLVAELLAEVARLRDQNAALREEIARLKGLKGRPQIKPSGMERAVPSARPHPAQGDPRGWLLGATSVVAPERRAVKIATEGALCGSICSHRLLEGTVIVSDDAGQFR